MKIEDKVQNLSHWYLQRKSNVHKIHYLTKINQDSRHLQIIKNRGTKETKRGLRVQYVQKFPTNDNNDLELSHDTPKITKQKRQRVGKRLIGPARAGFELARSREESRLGGRTSVMSEKSGEKRKKNSLDYMQKPQTTQAKQNAFQFDFTSLPENLGESKKDISPNRIPDANFTSSGRRKNQLKGFALKSKNNAFTSQMKQGSKEERLWSPQQIDSQRRQLQGSGLATFDLQFPSVYECDGPMSPNNFNYIHGWNYSGRGTDPSVMLGSHEQVHRPHDFVPIMNIVKIAKQTGRNEQAYMSNRTNNENYDQSTPPSGTVLLTAQLQSGRNSKMTAVIKHHCSRFGSNATGRTSPPLKETDEILKLKKLRDLSLISKRPVRDWKELALSGDSNHESAQERIQAYQALNQQWEYLSSPFAHEQPLQTAGSKSRNTPRSIPCKSGPTTPADESRQVLESAVTEIPEPSRQPSKRFTMESIMMIEQVSSDFKFEHKLDRSRVSGVQEKYSKGANKFRMINQSAILTNSSPTFPQRSRVSGESTNPDLTPEVLLEYTGNQYTSKPLREIVGGTPDLALIKKMSKMGKSTKSRAGAAVISIREEPSHGELDTIYCPQQHLVIDKVKTPREEQPGFEIKVKVSHDGLSSKRHHSPQDEVHFESRDAADLYPQTNRFNHMMPVGNSREEGTHAEESFEPRQMTGKYSMGRTPFVFGVCHDFAHAVSRGGTQPRRTLEQPGERRAVPPYVVVQAVTEERTQEVATQSTRVVDHTQSTINRIAAAPLTRQETHEDLAELIADTGEVVFSPSLSIGGDDCYKDAPCSLARTEKSERHMHQYRPEHLHEDITKLIHSKQKQKLVEFSNQVRNRNKHTSLSKSNANPIPKVAFSQTTQSQMSHHRNQFFKHRPTATIPHKHQQTQSLFGNEVNNDSFMQINSVTAASPQNVTRVKQSQNGVQLVLDLMPQSNTLQEQLVLSSSYCQQDGRGAFKEQDTLQRLQESDNNGLAVRSSVQVKEQQSQTSSRLRYQMDRLSFLKTLPFILKERQENQKREELEKQMAIQKILTQKAGEILPTFDTSMINVLEDNIASPPFKSKTSHGQRRRFNNGRSRQSMMGSGRSSLVINSSQAISRNHSSQQKDEVGTGMSTRILKSNKNSPLRYSRGSLPYQATFQPSQPQTTAFSQKSTRIAQSKVMQSPDSLMPWSTRNVRKVVESPMFLKNLEDHVPNIKNVKVQHYPSIKSPQDSRLASFIGKRQDFLYHSYQGSVRRSNQVSLCINTKTGSRQERRQKETIKAIKNQKNYKRQILSPDMLQEHLAASREQKANSYNFAQNRCLFKDTKQTRKPKKTVRNIQAAKINHHHISSDISNFDNKVTQIIQNFKAAQKQHLEERSELRSSASCANLASSALLCRGLGVVEGEPQARGQLAMIESHSNLRPLRPARALPSEAAEGMLVGAAAVNDSQGSGALSNLHLADGKYQISNPTQGDLMIGRSSQYTLQQILADDINIEAKIMSVEQQKESPRAEKSQLNNVEASLQVKQSENFSEQKQIEVVLT